jgi:hypothetical protein
MAEQISADLPKAKRASTHDRCGVLWAAWQ